MKTQEKPLENLQRRHMAARQVGIELGISSYMLPGNVKPLRELVLIALYFMGMEQRKAEFAKKVSEVETNLKKVASQAKILRDFMRDNRTTLERGDYIVCPKVDSISVPGDLCFPQFTKNAIVNFLISNGFIGTQVASIRNEINTQIKKGTIRLTTWAIFGSKFDLYLPNSSIAYVKQLLDYDRQQMALLENSK